MPKKRAAWIEGSIFLVQQKNGHSPVGQVIRAASRPLNSVIAALYNLREHEVPAEVDELELAAERLISILFVFPDPLNSGEWKVVGEQPPRHLDRMTLLPVGTDALSPEAALEQCPGLSAHPSGDSEEVENRDDHRERQDGECRQRTRQGILYLDVHCHSSSHQPGHDDRRPARQRRNPHPCDQKRCREQLQCSDRVEGPTGQTVNNELFFQRLRISAAVGGWYFRANEPDDDDAEGYRHLKQLDQGFHEPSMPDRPTQKC